jgi:cytochrome c peroxidase
MPEMSKEPVLGVPASSPSATTQGTSSAAGVGSNRSEGSKNPTVRLVPFQSMPQSTQEELGKELFDDLLLSIDNMKKLADSMQWCFKYTKVKLHLLLLAYVE